MRKKKKTNPNRVPIRRDAFNQHELTLDVTNNMVMRAWTLMLGALADFSGTTQESLVHLWDAVNRTSAKKDTIEDIEGDMRMIEERFGIRIRYKPIPAAEFKTQGDLNRFRNILMHNAMSAALTLIATPIIQERLVDEELLPRLLEKAYSLEEEISTKRISMQDIVLVLADEYSLRLAVEDNGIVVLHTIT